MVCPPCGVYIVPLQAMFQGCCPGCDLCCREEVVWGNPSLRERKVDSFVWYVKKKNKIFLKSSGDCVRGALLRVICQRGLRGMRGLPEGAGDQCLGMVVPVCYVGMAMKVVCLD